MANVQAVGVNCANIASSLLKTPGGLTMKARIIRGCGGRSDAQKGLAANSIKVRC